MRTTVALATLLTASLAAQPGLASADSFARRDIAVVWVEMLQDACAQVSRAGDLEGADRCAVEWLAWLQEELPPSPHCQQHGAQVASIAACVDAIAHALRRYADDDDLGPILALTAPGSACNEVALCGASKTGR